MSAKLDRIIKGLKEAIREANRRRTSSLDTPATVTRIDGDTMYVHMDGGTPETPVKKTIDAKIGDTVQVRAKGGQAWVTGNQTAPPTDDTVAHASAKTATDYVTDTNDGIFVHRNNDNKNGVRIRNNVDIVRNGKSVANYGENARIGRTDGARMVVGSDNIQGINESGYELFRLGFDGESDLISYFDDNVFEADVTSYQGTVATFSAELPSILPTGAMFRITLNTDRAFSVIFDDMQIGVASSQTKTSSNDYTLNYNGESTITINGMVRQSVVPSGTDSIWRLRCRCSTTIKTPSFTLGNRKTLTKGKYSVALGEGLIAEADHQVVIGKYNDNDDNASFIVGNSGNIFTVKNDGNVYADADYYSGVNELELGTMILPAILTSTGSELYFTIPTGRLFPSGTTVSSLQFNMNGRAGSSEGQGYYIVRGSSSGTDTAPFGFGSAGGTTAFYNANNNQKLVTPSMWTVSFQGGTNILVTINGGENYFFSGNATKDGYLNNQPVVLYLTYVTVGL